LPIISSITQRYIERRILQNVIKVEGALISIEPKTGYVKALIGGREFKGYSSFNRAMSAYRQVGSAFKPFVYGAGLYFKKITPATLIYDSPEVGIKETGEIWLPKNYERKHYGYVTIRKALAMSINIASLRIAELVGIERIAEFTKTLLHLSEETSKRRIPIIPSLALGSIELTPYEIASAYAIIANYGKNVTPIFIKYIVDMWGNIIYQYRHKINKQITIHNLIQLSSPIIANIINVSNVRLYSKSCFLRY
jgi:penicillin-binding protein 1A